MGVVGWDIGGSNVKAALVSHGRVVSAVSRPFELRLAPGQLAQVLREVAVEATAGTRLPHAITMTAELSRNFRTKREGVSFVLAAVEAAFGAADVHVFTVDGRFLASHEARVDALSVASANWMATARLVADAHPDAILIDIGSTTTDIIPIVGGTVAAAGRTDPERLASGELLYSGAARTPAEALAPDVEIRGTRYALAAEGFATSGDIHLWLGDLAPEDLAGGTADGRPATREFAGERLRRMICADRDLLDEAGVSSLAECLAASQVRRIEAAIRQVHLRHPAIAVAVVAGLGAFMARRAAMRAGLDVVALAAEHGEGASRCAPAAAVAALLERELSPAAIEVVVKIGGGLLATPDRLREVLAHLDGAAGLRALVVPGGGPFADAVRATDEAIGLGDDAAHWMAILAMDQYAELLASMCTRARVVTSLAAAVTALAAGALPVLAPSRWLRQADPLPHSWDVTSDSIAAWIAGEARACRLVLVKPPGAEGVVVDASFDAVLPPSVAAVAVAADRMDRLAAALPAG